MLTLFAKYKEALVFTSTILEILDMSTVTISCSGSRDFLALAAFFSPTSRFLFLTLFLTLELGPTGEVPPTHSSLKYLVLPTQAPPLPSPTPRTNGILTFYSQSPSATSPRHQTGRPPSGSSPSCHRSPPEHSENNSWMLFKQEAGRSPPQRDRNRG